MPYNGDSPTIKKAPPYDDRVSPIENSLELFALTELGDDIYTNLRPLWHPPNARGIFGGAVIAQSLGAAMKTVPDGFIVHSMHCYFVLAGNSEIPVIYHVERVREGRSFATRTVQARQRGRCIFTTTCSFQIPAHPHTHMLSHAEPLPTSLSKPEDCSDGTAEAAELVRKGIISEASFKAGIAHRASDPFERRPMQVLNDSNDSPAEIHTKRVRSWVRAKGRISAPKGGAAHLEALAYMSDSWFIGTVGRAHKATDIGMMVSLDHTIYFHAPFRADEWMLMDVLTPWTGDQRGLVQQRIMAQDGTLLATCYQEGVVRLRELKGENPEEIRGSAIAVKKESKL